METVLSTKIILHWTPRLLTILFILFISLFALDVFSEGYSFLQTLVALFMHLIPSFVLIIALAVAWKWELAGGILFLLITVGFTLFFRTYREPGTFLILSAPLLLVGILFVLSHYWPPARAFDG